jgi:cold shock protein
MATGTVKFFDDQRGFGFISRENAEDLFVHSSQVAGEGRKTLHEGQAVTFEVGAGRRGDEARNVTTV